MKDELLKQIHDEVKRRVDDDPKDPFYETATFNAKVSSFMRDALDEEQLTKILEFMQNDTQCKYTGDLFREVKSAGLLKCKPTVVYSSDSKKPSLCIAYNKYLHDFRGYYFQVSGTRDGIGSWATSCFRLDRLCKLIHDWVEDDDEAGLLTNHVVTLAALTTLFDYYECTHKMLKESREVLERFLNETVATCYRSAAGKTEQPLALFLDTIRCSKSNEPPTIDPGDLNVLLKDGDVCYGFLVCNEKSLAFTSFNGEQYETVTLNPPTLPEDLSHKKNVFAAAYVEFLLKYSGVRVNYTAMYPVNSNLKKFKPFRMNVPNVAEKFDTVHDLVTEYYKGFSLDEINVF